MEGNGSARVRDEVFERMVATFEAPNGRHHAWEVNTCELNGTGTGFDVEEVMAVLVKQAEDELKERRCRQQTKRSEEAQQARLATRRLDEGIIVNNASILCHWNGFHSIAIVKQLSKTFSIMLICSFANGSQRSFGTRVFCHLT
jgi:hypothetical protein